MSTCKIDAQGRISTPAKWRVEQGIKPGAELVVLEEDGRLIVQTREQAVREAQAIIGQYIPRDVSLVEELAKDRRREVEMENREVAPSAKSKSKRG